MGLAAFMLQLNAVRADVACATHEVAAAEDAPAQDATPAHGHHDAEPPSGDAADESDCEMPAQNGCCQAMTSCAPSVGLGAETRVAEWSPVHDASGARYSAHALTRSTAPEPPPPRL